MFRYRIRPLFVLVIALVCAKDYSFAQTNDSWREEVNVYQPVFNAPLTLTSGEQISLYQLADNNPVIIALIFTRCSGICTPFLLRLKEDIRLAENAENYPYKILVVSFDPRDSLEDMKRMADNLELSKSSDWKFGVTDSILPLINSVAFEPIWSEEMQQFDHDALLVGVNSNGYISRKLLGMRDSRDLSMLIASVNNQFAPTFRLPGGNKLFSCFNYDPVTGKNTPGLGLLFILLPAVLSAALLIGIRLSVRKKSGLKNHIPQS